jgi:hypothetical protein
VSHSAGRFIRIVVFPLRFATPVIYAIPAGSMLADLQILIPFTAIMNTIATSPI